METRLLAIPGVTRPYPHLTRHRLEMTRYSLGEYTEETGITAADVQNGWPTGPAYERMGAERGQHDPWTPGLVAAVAADLEARLPLADWEQHVAARDAGLLRQAARGGQPG
ncbi:MAG TPA: hypothetical protein VH478_14495 [Trebonia sp.]|jgi:hypothetical protein|nr:hypothetical protein [Trebonia sp.]